MHKLTKPLSMFKTISRRWGPESKRGNCQLNISPKVGLSQATN